MGAVQQLLLAGGVRGSVVATPPFTLFTKTGVQVGAITFPWMTATNYNLQEEITTGGSDTWYTQGPWYSKTVGNHTRDYSYGATVPYVTRLIDQLYAGGYDFMSIDWYMDSNWDFAGYKDPHGITPWKAYAGQNTFLDNYLASPNAGKVKFCLDMITVDFNAVDWQAICDAAVVKMQSPHYQYDLTTGRPLVMFYALGAALAIFGSSGALTAAITTFRNTVTAAGLPNPYLVTLESGAFIPDSFDAVGQYSYLDPGGAGSDSTAQAYSVLTGIVETAWAGLLSRPMIPTAQVGINYAARIAYATSIGADFGYAHHGYITQPTDAQFATHMKAGRDFITAHPTECALQTLLVESVGENSEGGTIEQTLGDTIGSLGRIQAPAQQLGIQREPLKNLRARGVTNQTYRG